MVLARSTDRYAVPKPEGAYTIAVICPVAGQRRVVLYELRADDVREIHHRYPCAAPTATLAGAMSGATTPATIFWGGHVGTADGSSYTVSASAGAHDLVAVRMGGDAGVGIRLADRVVIRRGVTAGTGVDLDVSDAAGTATQRLTVSGIAYNDRTVVVADAYLLTTGGTYAFLSSTVLQEDLGMQVDTLPASELEPKELGVVSVLHAGLESGGSTPIHIDERAARGFAAFATSLPAVNETSTPEITWAALQPYAMVRAHWTPVPATAYRLVASTYSNERVEWIINTSSTDAAGGITWTFPDLSTLPGWSQALGFRSLGTMTWQVTSRSGAPLAQLIQQYPTVEANIDATGRAGNIMIPPF